MTADQIIRPGVIFLHIGWANEYLGAPDDLPQGKFGYIRDGNVDMGESMNFKDHGRCFGYAPHHGVNLRRLGAAPGAEDFMDGVLVVWTAGNPDGSGRYVVGWYENARVYVESQEDQEKSRYGFIAEAAVNDCRLLPVDKGRSSYQAWFKGGPASPMLSTRVTTWPRSIWARCWHTSRAGHLRASMMGRYLRLPGMGAVGSTKIRTNARRSRRLPSRR